MKRLFILLVLGLTVMSCSPDKKKGATAVGFYMFFVEDYSATGAIGEAGASSAAGS